MMFSRGRVENWWFLWLETVLLHDAGTTRDKCDSPKGRGTSQQRSRKGLYRASKTQS